MEQLTAERKKIKIPWGSVAAAAAAVAAAALFYGFRGTDGFADRVSAHFSGPIRGAVGAACALVPFSVMELLYVAGILFAVWFLVRSIVLLVRETQKFRILGRRVFILLLILAYIWLGYCWLWGIDYYGTSFAEKSGLNSDGATVEELYAVTCWFAKNANALAPQVRRDAEGHYAEYQAAYFADYARIYDNVEGIFPCLEGTSLRPKKMLFSRIMSRMGFTGIYFPFTGESNINVDPPGSTTPFTIAHELAHQRGIAAEQEANFVGIMACVTSGKTAYEYAGWLSGLTYLSNALYRVSPEAWQAVSDTLCDEIRTDWQDSSAYWSSLESKVTAVSETVYDGYLKAQGQTLGIQSYGACVDLLVEYFLQVLPAAGQE